MLSATCPSRGFTDPARARSRFWASWADYGLTEVIPPTTRLRPDDAGNKSGSGSWPATLVQRFLLRRALPSKNRIDPDKRAPRQKRPCRTGGNGFRLHERNPDPAFSESPTNRTEDGEATSTHRGLCDRVDSFRFVSYALRAAQLHEKRSWLKRIFNDLRTFFDPVC